MPRLSLFRGLRDYDRPAMGRRKQKRLPTIPNETRRRQNRHQGAEEACSCLFHRIPDRTRLGQPECLRLPLVKHQGVNRGSRKTPRVAGELRVARPHFAKIRERGFSRYISALGLWRRKTRPDRVWYPARHLRGLTVAQAYELLLDRLLQSIPPRFPFFTESCHLTFQFGPCRVALVLCLVKGRVLDPFFQFCEPGGYWTNLLFDVPHFLKYPAFPIT